MKSKSIFATVGVAGTLLGVTGAVVASAGAANTPVVAEGAMPPWARADGSTDEAKLPKTIALLGADGQYIRDASGAVVYVPFPRPGIDPAAAQALYQQVQKLRMDDAKRRGLGNGEITSVSGATTP